MADRDRPLTQYTARSAQHSAEAQRLEQARSGSAPWRQWGPYLADRQWGTVREDYSADGTAWDSFPHDHARSRAYRWGEDGLLGICDDEGYLCFALALWNGVDPILKERLFGLTGPEGNHSEDVKEYYYYLDSTPTHSYMKALYRYPQRPFPYAELVAESRRRGRQDPEYELLDTGVFDGGRYFDVTVEYAKATPYDILIQISATNRGSEPAPLHILPTLWFRNTWAWGRDDRRPHVRIADCGLRNDGAHGTAPAQYAVLRTEHHALGEHWLACEGTPALLFTENDSNAQRLWGVANRTPYVKDGINEAVVHGDAAAVNPEGVGTKAAAQYAVTIAPGATETVRLRLGARRHAAPFAGFDELVLQRRTEADEFYSMLAPVHLPGCSEEDEAACTEDARAVQRQAFAGLLWSKQWYYFDVDQWLEGDPAGPPPPDGRKRGRNADWRHLNNADVISMPDTWEYPWYAAWDLAFHCIPLALVDPQFAKHQLTRLLREWYQHPNGQIPAYEWAFGDVNPPVHAWAAWRVFKIEQRRWGRTDHRFLERVFHKLMINFTWWVNRKDPEGRNVFQGGFLGLDNIGVFDRSATLPTGGHLEQSDGTSWMGMFSLNMMTIALELAQVNSIYEDIATKFFEHFLYIAGAMNNIAGEGISLWDESDEFFYDVLHVPSGDPLRLKVRSLVGLIPLLAVETIEPALLERLPNFKRRLEWFLANRPHLASLVSRWYEPGAGERRLLALVRGHRMKRLLARMLDPEEFLSDYGIRSLSRYHRDHPYVLYAGGMEHRVGYEPAESGSGLFGGNSNWRGPIWFPINYLLIESLQKFHHYYSDDFTVECPTGSGQYLTLREIADEISQRLIRIFLRDREGQRPCLGLSERVHHDPQWSRYPLFFEYFHGDTGAGLGASHQTGWTALVAKLIEQQGKGAATHADSEPAVHFTPH
jgi:hypothetical protein